MGLKKISSQEVNWYDYDHETRFPYRRALHAELDNARKRCSHRGEIDNEKFMNYVLTMCIRQDVGWSGYTDEKGKPVPCNDVEIRELPLEVKLEIFNRIVGAESDEQTGASEGN